MSPRFSVRTLWIVLLLLAPGQAANWWEPYDKGKQAFEAGRWAEAITNLTKAIAIAPTAQAGKRAEGERTEDYFPYYYLGVAYLRVDRLEEARVNLTKASAGPRMPGPLAADLSRYLRDLNAREAQMRPAAAAARPSPAPSSVPPPGVIERYPAIDAPDKVTAGQSIPLQFSLTENRTESTARVVSGKASATGALQIPMPVRQFGLTIDVILSAPGFEVDSPVGSVLLSPTGDSTTALFHLKAPTGLDAATWRTVYITLWYSGTFLAKVSRDILTVPSAASAVPPHPPSLTSPTLALMPAATAPDLTIWENPEGHEIILESPYLQPQRHLLPATAPDLAAWIRTNFAVFSQAGRGVTVPGASSTLPSPNKELRIALMKGFGRELFRKAAPAAFQQAFWRLKDLRGDRFRSIQIFSSNPLIPWELMRPSRPDGSDEGDFLGVAFSIARWHVTSNAMTLDRPPQTTTLSDLAVVAPQYAGRLELPNQQLELAALRQFQTYRAVAPTMAAMAELIRHFPKGIIHFSGHGDVTQSGSQPAQYLVRLQDGDLDVATWEGLTAARTDEHPFVFLNACETGQAQQVASFVDGWAPRVLEAGAGGYVGAMWSVGDRGAAEFAGRFYDRLREGLKTGPVNVAEIVRQGRLEFQATGDPTFLAYVFYGDPAFAFVPAK